MSMAAKKYLQEVANKNYLETIRKRKEENRKEQDELDSINRKIENQKNRKGKK
mgnify:CR=1 FL=1